MVPMVWLKHSTWMSVLADCARRAQAGAGAGRGRGGRVSCRMRAACGKIKSLHPCTPLRGTPLHLHSPLRPATRATATPRPGFFQKSPGILPRRGGDWVTSFARIWAFGRCVALRWAGRRWGVANAGAGQRRSTLTCHFFGGG